MFRRWTCRCLVWRDGADSTPYLPKEEPYILFELLPSWGFCLAACNQMTGLTAQQLSFSSYWAELSTSLCLLLEGHILFGPHLLSARMGTSMCCLRPPRFPVLHQQGLSGGGLGMCSSLQGCAPVFLDHKAKPSFKAIVSTVLVLLGL